MMSWIACASVASLVPLSATAVTPGVVHAGSLVSPPVLQTWLLCTVKTVSLRAGGVSSTKPSPPAGIQSRIAVMMPLTVWAAAPLKTVRVWPAIGAVTPTLAGLTMIVIVPSGL